MRNGFFELDFVDEDMHLLARKEDIKQFKYYQYNRKKDDGTWFKDWAFSFIMNDGMDYPVSKQTFLSIANEALDAISYQNIINRIGMENE